MIFFPFYMWVENNKDIEESRKFFGGIISAYIGPRILEKCNTELLHAVKNWRRLIGVLFDRECL